MSVYKRKLPGGGFTENYYYEFEMNGKRHRGCCDTSNKAEALAFEAKLRLQAKEVKDSPGTKFWTLEQTAESWLEEGRTERADWKNDESRVRKLFGREKRGDKIIEGARYGLNPRLPVHEFTEGILADLMAARRRETRWGREDTGSASGATWNRELALVQALFEHARKNRAKLPKNPVEWRDYKAQERKGKLRYLSHDEEALLLEALAKKVRFYKDPNGAQARMAQDQFDLVVFLLDTGARYNEVAMLTWDVVDLDRRTVNLYREKVDNEGTLGMTARLHGLLLSRRAAAGGSPYIFPAWDRGRIVMERARGWSTAGIQDTMDRLGFNEQALVSRKGKATAHTFRDTFAARQIEAGATLYELQHLLGHASPTMTQKYAHIYDDFGAKAASRLDKLHASKGAAGTARAVSGLLGQLRNQGDDPIASAGSTPPAINCATRVTTLSLTSEGS